MKKIEFNFSYLIGVLNSNPNQSSIERANKKVEQLIKDIDSEINKISV